MRHTYTNSTQYSPDYTLFAQECEKYGYTFEPYIVTTADEWSLTVFHITGTTDEQTSDRYSDDDKMPVLSISGSFGDA